MLEKSYSKLRVAATTFSLTLHGSLGIFIKSGPLAQFGRASRHNTNVAGRSPVDAARGVMFVGYILRSLKNGTHYVGHTDDLHRRVSEHNNGLSRYTRHRGPWVLVYMREFKTRADAMEWERKVKARKSREYIEQLIESYKKIYS